jgi:hypothetical protein
LPFKDGKGVGGGGGSLKMNPHAPSEALDEKLSFHASKNERKMRGKKEKCGTKSALTGPGITSFKPARLPKAV